VKFASPNANAGPGTFRSYFRDFFSFFSPNAIGRGWVTAVKTGYRFIIFMSNLLLYSGLKNQSLTFEKSRIDAFFSPFPGEFAFSRGRSFFFERGPPKKTEGKKKPPGKGINS